MGFNIFRGLINAKALIITSTIKPYAITFLAAMRYNVPYWLLWGIAGAESSWGRKGNNLFGLKSAAEGANVSDWKQASNQAAYTLQQLYKQYHNWDQAVKHYSGYAYGVSWPKQLAKEQGLTV